MNINLQIVLITILVIVFEIYNINIINVPYSVKCFYGENDCYQGDINGSEIPYFILFFLLGRKWPNRALLAFLLSMIIEIAKHKMGLNHKYIINPLIALTGYMIGSVYFKKINIS